MNQSARSTPWTLVALLAALFLAFELGAGTSIVGSVTSDQPMSVWTDTREPDPVLNAGHDPEEEGVVVFEVPVDMVFVLKDLLVANTQGANNKEIKVSDDIYPTLTDATGIPGDTAPIRIGGTNLQDWGTGVTESKFGGGRRGSRRLSQTGLVGLTGGVVFDAGTSVVVHDYEGPLYFDGILIPLAGL